MRWPHRFARASWPTWARRVIKVERPGSGDFARGYDQRVQGQSSHFTWINRSKQSLALDLKQDEAMQALLQLLEGADVLVQNLAPGACRAHGPVLCGAARALSAPHRLRHQRLRRRRPLPRQEGLRPADPERGGLSLGHGHARGAVQGRHLGGRHRGRHVCLHQHPVGPAAARAHGRGQPHRRVHAGGAGRVDGLPHVLRLRRRAAAAAHRRLARQHLSLRAFRGR